MSRPRRFLGPALPYVALLLLSACASDEIEAPQQQTDGTLSVDASTGWAFASISDESIVTVSDPAASSDWEIGFNATRVMLNGGAAGPGGVLGYCICQNAGATDAETVAMTADAELPDFDAVTEADIPDDPKSFEWRSCRRPSMAGTAARARPR